MKEVKSVGATGWIRRHPLLIVVVVLLLADLILFVEVFDRGQGKLRVSFLDVGQGDAILIEAPNGNQLLYDAGPPSGATLRALGRELSFWDDTINVTVFSHPDMDHIGEFPEIFRRYDVGVAVLSGASSDNGAHEASEIAIKNEGAGRLIAMQGMQIDFGSGVLADIFYPNHDASQMETNSASIVMRLHYGETSFLFSGDLPKNIEKYLVGLHGNALRSNVLKIGHHGSRTSTSEEWLRTVDPEVAVISAGKDNRYGHPHKEVVELLERLEISTLKTPEEGTITFTSDGKTITRE